MHGPLEGKRLDIWPFQVIKAEDVEDPGSLLIHDSDQLGIAGTAMAMTVGRHNLGTAGVLPPGFRRTMSDPDPRLHELAPGVGVIGEHGQRFYPLDPLPVTETFEGRQLTVVGGSAPHARFDDGTRPMQLFCRWYGFCLTFPGTSVHGMD